MWAIINTVDSFSTFPARGVYLFNSQSEALGWAVDCICKVGQIDPSGRSPNEILNGFQDILGATEYFHIERVRKTARNQIVDQFRTDFRQDEPMPERDPGKWETDWVCVAACLLYAAMAGVASIVVWLIASRS